jgi:hypothetical protein
MIDPTKDCVVKSGYNTGKTTVVHKYIKKMDALQSHSLSPDLVKMVLEPT